MIQLVGIELFKLRTRRSAWAFIAACLGLVLMSVVGELASGPLEPGRGVQSVLSNAGTSGILVLLAGMLVSVGEYRHGTISRAFITIPRRGRVITAKAIALVVVGAIVGLVSVLVAAVIAFPWLAADGIDIGLTSHDIGTIFGACVVFSALSGALGVGLGSIFGEHGAALALTMVGLIIFEITLASLLPEIERYGPGAAGVALSGLPSDTLLSMWVGGLVYGGYAVLALGAATWLTQRRDIAA
jgi:ABC-2 type transport system permease protein